MGSFEPCRRNLLRPIIRQSLGTTVHLFSDGVTWRTPDYEVEPEPKTKAALDRANAIRAETSPQGRGELKIWPSSERLDLWHSLSNRRGVVFSHFQDGPRGPGREGDRMLTILNAPNMQSSPIADKCKNGDFSMLQMLVFLWDTIHHRNASYTGFNDLRPEWANAIREFAKEIRPGNAAAYVQFVAAGPLVVPRIRIVEQPWTLEDCNSFNGESPCSSFEIFAAGDEVDEAAKRLVMEQASRKCASNIQSAEGEPQMEPQRESGLSGGQIALIATASVAALGIGWALLRKRKATPNRSKARRR